MVSVEYVNLTNANVAFDLDCRLENLTALEIAEKAYYAALTKAKAEWNTLEISEDVRDSAQINADDTSGTAEDKLQWYCVAIDTAKMVLSYAVPC